MRIEELRLRKYGLFEDTTLGFDAGCSVVYGENEAGKSTLLDALGDFLWGIKSGNHPRGFNYKPKDMLLTCTASLEGDQQIFHRRLKELKDADLQVVSAPWGEGPSGLKSWKQGFGLDLDSLQEGGRQLVLGKGDLAEIVFLAEEGVAIGRVRDRLSRRMDEVYRERKGAKCEVSEALQHIAALQKQIDDTEVSAGDVERVRAELARLTLGLAASQEESKALAAETRRLEELDRCFETAAELREVAEERSKLDQQGATLSEVESERLRQAVDTVISSTTERATLEHSMSTQRERRKSLTLNPGLLDAAQEIEELHGQIKSVQADQGRSTNTDKRDSLQASLRSALRELGDEPESDLGAQVAGLRIPADKRDQLDRLDTAIGAAKSAVEQAQREMAKAQSSLAKLTQSADGTGVASDLTKARSLRDADWAEIRQPWLSGELPEEATRSAMSKSLDSTINASDLVAEEHSEQLASAALFRGERQAAERAVESRDIALGVRQAEMAEAELSWNTLIAAWDLPEGLDAGAWTVRAGVLTRLDSAWADLEKHLADLASAQASVERFDASAQALSGLLGNRESDSIRAVESLSRQLSEARVAEGRKSEIDENIEKATDKLGESTVRHDLASLTVASFKTDYGEDPDALLSRSGDAHRLDKALDDLTAGLKRQRNAGSDLSKLLAQLAASSKPDLSEKLESCGVKRGEMQAEVQNLSELKGAVGKQLESLESGDPVNELKSKRVSVGEQLRELVDEYQLLRVQVEMLDALLERATGQHHSQLIDDAGEILNRITGGRYVAFEVVTESERSWLEIQLPAEPGEMPGRIELSGLSEGTSDQVFLALRLAGIKARQAERRESGLPTLPVVLDDVLMAHDDDRAAEALEVLGELGEDFQIILLSHHRSVALAAQTCAGVGVVNLPTTAAAVA